MDQAITLFFNGSHSLYLDAFAWNATQLWVWLPFLLVIVYVLFREHDFSHFLFIILATAICVIVTDQIASAVFKPWIARWRPTHTPEIMHTVDVVRGYRGGFYGFFSSHAANTSAIATFLSLVIRHRNTSVALVLWVLLNCWTRLYLGAHYFGDLFVGCCFGASLGFIAYRCYRHYFSDAASFHYNNSLLRYIPLAFVITLCALAIPWHLSY